MSREQQTLVVGVDRELYCREVQGIGREHQTLVVGVD